MEHDASLEQVAESEKRAKRLAMVGVVLSVLTLFAVMVAVGVMVSGLKRTVDELSAEINMSATDAILASANVNDKTNVSVPVLYYDQKMDECVDLYDMGRRVELETRVFEWNKCGYYNGGLERGLIGGLLGEEYLPVAVGGELTTNRGINDTNFKKWFSQVDGESKVYAKTLQLVYDAGLQSFVYKDAKFYPLNDVNYDRTEIVNNDGNNHLFTMNVGVPIQVMGSGEEEFEIVADDDTWVFVGNKMVIDMGGVHDVITGRFKIMENGEVYSAVENEEYVYAGVNVKVGDGVIVRVFHADRNSEGSVMEMSFKKMILNITDATLARGEGVEVAYDPTNPGYVAPLGESMTVRADRTRGLAMALTAQLIMFGVLAVVFVMVVTRLLRKI